MTASSIVAFKDKLQTIKSEVNKKIDAFSINASWDYYKPQPCRETHEWT